MGRPRAGAPSHRAPHACDWIWARPSARRRCRLRLARTRRARPASSRVERPACDRGRRRIRGQPGRCRPWSCARLHLGHIGGPRGVGPPDCGPGRTHARSPARSSGAHLSHRLACIGGGCRPFCRLRGGRVVGGSPGAFRRTLPSGPRSQAGRVRFPRRLDHRRRVQGRWTSSRLCLSSLAWHGCHHLSTRRRRSDRSPASPPGHPGAAGRGACLRGRLRGLSLAFRRRRVRSHPDRLLRLLAKRWRSRGDRALRDAPSAAVGDAHASRQQR